MNKYLILLLVFLFSINAQASASSKQEERIEQYKELFSAFPDEIKEKIKKGQIEEGFTKNMVYMAIGSPSKMFSEGDTTNWEYWVESPRPKDLYPLESMNYPYLSVQVEFSGDTVKSIKRIGDAE